MPFILTRYNKEIASVIPYSIKKEDKIIIDNSGKKTGVLVNELYKKCSVCQNVKDDVHSVEYIQDGVRTEDLMCLSCEKKIPAEMRIIKNRDIPAVRITEPKDKNELVFKFCKHGAMLGLCKHGCEK